MVYHTTLILLAKPYISEAQGVSPLASFAGSKNGETGCLLQKALNVSLEAAKQICTLGDQYREVFGSFRRSPITATHSTLSAILTLLARNSGDGNSGAQTENIESGLKTLKELSTSWLPPGRYHDYIRRMLQEKRPAEVDGTIPSPVPLCHHPQQATAQAPLNNANTCGVDIVSGANQVPLVPSMEEDAALVGFLGQADMFMWMNDESLVGFDNAMPFGGDPLLGQEFTSQDDGFGGAPGQCQ